MLAGAAALVTAVDPSDTALVPACPWLTLTGWWCPGCGLTRATHHLLRGDVATALAYNLLVVPVLAAIVLSWWTWLRTSRPGAGPARRVPISVVLVVSSVAIAFAVVRNLPGVDGLRG